MLRAHRPPGCSELLDIFCHKMEAYLRRQYLRRLSLQPANALCRRHSQGLAREVQGWDRIGRI